MEWQQLLGFYHVAQLGSFTKAAEATLRTQSALSQQIKALEEEFACQLLERIGKRTLKLTPAGEKVLAFAQLMFSRYDTLQEELAEIKGLPRGRLQIAAPFTTLLHLLPNLLQDYSRKFPHVQFTILDRPQESVVQLVKTGVVDFGFALESIVPGDLQSRSWQQVRTVLMVPPDHPLAGAGRVSLAEIARYPLIVPRMSLLSRLNRLTYFPVKAKHRRELCHRAGLKSIWPPYDTTITRREAGSAGRRVLSAW